MRITNLGRMKMRFVSAQPPDKKSVSDDFETTLAVSPDSKLLGVVDRAGFLQVYLIENGLRLPIPDGVGKFTRIHGFLENNRIIVDSGGTWILDIHSYQFLTKLPSLNYFRHAFALCGANGGLLAKSKKDKLKLCNLGEKEFNCKTVPIRRQPPSSKLLNEKSWWWPVRGKFEMRKGEEEKDKFEVDIEPWNVECGLAALFLNNEERVAIIGKHTIQLYNIENKKLLFIWACDPDDEIKEVESCHYHDEHDENIKSDRIRVVTNKGDIKIRLPNQDEANDYDTMLYFCKFLAKYASSSRQIPFNVTDRTLKEWNKWLEINSKIVKEEIRKRIGDFLHFNRFHSSESPVSNLVIAGCEDVRTLFSHPLFVKII